ncbi:choline binding protein PcpA [Streptococcus pneumoniae]|nr:choline binding protein PcpA [Streptococcus pneumoniae]
MATGWVKDKGLWYYLNESGSMATKKKKKKKLWYYLNESGSMATGWVKDKGLMNQVQWLLVGLQFLVNGTIPIIQEIY